MAGEQTEYHLPAHLAQIAAASEYALNIAVANRMRQLGIPEEMIGYTINRKRTNAFTRESVRGGTNMPSRYGAQPGIAVDHAVLDPRYPAGPNDQRMESWETASVQERIDAVIVHEYIEALASHAPPGWNPARLGPWNPHKHAVFYAPALAEQWAMTVHTRQILAETRVMEGLAS